MEAEAAKLIGAGIAVIVYPGADDDKLTIVNIQNLDLIF